MYRSYLGSLRYLSSRTTARLAHAPQFHLRLGDPTRSFKHRQH